jgi:double-stranded uracil-DNA glycosylase
VARKKRDKQPYKPTKEEIQAAEGKTVPDVIAPGLGVLFCGINPGLYTAAVGHHFARPGNRFWPALYAAGFSSRLLSPFEERELLKSGYGITNMVAHATATSVELSKDDFIKGGKRLLRKIRRYKPRFVAILGLGAYRTAFGQPKAQVGRQNQSLNGSEVWVLPNPSGLNAHFQLKDLGAMFHELKKAVEASSDVTL